MWSQTALPPERQPSLSSLFLGTSFAMSVLKSRSSPVMSVPWTDWKLDLPPQIIIFPRTAEQSLALTQKRWQEQTAGGREKSTTCLFGSSVVKTDAERSKRKLEYYMTGAVSHSVFFSWTGRAWDEHEFPLEPALLYSQLTPVFFHYLEQWSDDIWCWEPGYHSTRGALSRILTF